MMFRHSYWNIFLVLQGKINKYSLLVLSVFGRKKNFDCSKWDAQNSLSLTFSKIIVYLSKSLSCILKFINIMHMCVRIFTCEPLAELGRGRGAMPPSLFNFSIYNIDKMGKKNENL